MGPPIQPPLVRLRYLSGAEEQLGGGTTQNTPNNGSSQHLFFCSRRHFPAGNSRFSLLKKFRISEQFILCPPRTQFTVRQPYQGRILVNSIPLFFRRLGEGRGTTSWEVFLSVKKPKMVLWWGPQGLAEVGGEVEPPRCPTFPPTYPHNTPH